MQLIINKQIEETKMKTFEEMNKAELRAACKAAGIKNYGKMDNAGMRAALEFESTFAAKSEPAKGSLSDIVNSQILERANTIPAPLTKQELEMEKVTAMEKSVKDEKNGIQRPKAGTKTGAIWELCDRLYAELQRIPKINEIRQLAGEVNQNMMKSQYAYWRKYQGFTKPRIAKV